MRLAIVALLAVAVAIATAAPPETVRFKPTPVTFSNANATLNDVAVGLSKSSAGVTVAVESPEAAKAKCPVDFTGTPFWEALETAADASKTRITLRDGGKRVILEPRPNRREISAVSGPFRIVPRSVTGRLLLDSDTIFHDIQLDVHWEPRLPVFRIDGNPRITKAIDDRGTALTVAAGNARHHPSTSATDMRVRLTGLTRESKRIGVLEGEFRATASAQMLAIPFENLGDKLPATKTEEGVKVTLQSFTKTDQTWEAELELLYPESHPFFESFEEQKWLRDNRARLVSPAGKPLDPDSEDVTAAGRKVIATYRFKTKDNPAAKGWVLVCETPGPLAEATVPFTLKDIPIP